MNRPIMKRFWLLLAMVCLASAADISGQERTNVTGFIFGVNDERLEQVQVELLNETDSVIARTKSDAGGKYTFTGAPPGRLSVRVLPMATNYEQQTRAIEQSDVGNRGRLTQNVQMDFRLRLRRN